ncbi:hypothetical protein HAX54_050386 [Datura stramonium]|uniref:Uncharacterized protein n=1 Tax=Datura stramonium TaxID=4076 RepID=A0ABS8WQ51_DATST|nr:hypothetical protein [Datura stramonium]
MGKIRISESFLAHSFVYAVIKVKVVESPVGGSDSKCEETMKREDEERQDGQRDFWRNLGEGRRVVRTGEGGLGFARGPGRGGGLAGKGGRRRLVERRGGDSGGGAVSG